MMKRVLIGIVVVAVLAGGVWGYTTYVHPNLLDGSGTANGSAQADTTPIPQDSLENVIWASGKLEPDAWAALSPAAGGTVQTIAVSEGDWVEKGQVLVEVENAILQSEVEVAAAALAEAQAAHAKLMADPTNSELAAAMAELASAKSAVTLAEGQSQEAEAAVESARAELQIAQQQYNELASHPTAAERRAAEAQVAIAQAEVTRAQAAYNQVRGDPQIGARPESMALQQATASLAAAQAQYDQAVQGATPEELAVARAQIAAARARVTVAESKLPSVQAAVQAANARKASAQAALDSLLSGATPEDIAMSQARVQSAQAALARAKAQLSQTQVIAPFAGQVGTISVHPGEVATPGQTVLLLGDTRQMYVETTDLRETDVVRLITGMPVEVTFDALPDQIFTGTITRIAPVSSTEKGSTNYTVDVDVQSLDESLRWGMTAFVNIQAQ